MNETKNEWCWSTDDEKWETAPTREAAIAAAKADAHKRKRTEYHLGKCSWASHEAMVGHLGEDVREALACRAADDGGDFGDEYPDMPSKPFDEALEAFVLAWLKEHADHPRWFSVEDQETIDLAEQS